MNRRASKRDREERDERLERLEAKNAELARTLQLVEEARASLADQYDFAPIGFVTLDAKGCIREINLTAAKLLGRERAYLLTMPFLTYVARSHCAVFLDHLRHCRKDQTKVISDLALRMGRYQTVPVEMRSVPVLDPHRGDTVYRTAITDITERLRAGKALEESEERYRDVVELSPDGMFIQREGKIVFSNTAGLRLCGAHEPNELIGCRILDLVRPAFRKRVVEDVLDPPSPSSETSRVEAKFARRDGSSIDVEVAARGLIYNGEQAVLVVVRDITRSKRAERHVLAISEREQARFGQDLHDGLCQSLAGAACLAEALRIRSRAADATFSADADEIASIIGNCIEESRRLAKGLFPVSVETNGLVSALSELASEVTRCSRVACALECDDSLAVRDPVVATNLYRIAQEGIANAIKHGAAQSVIIALVANNGNTTLTVRDDGKGIPAKPKPTGMGLHTMRYRASVIGGLLDVRRDGQRGTIVTCSFPTSGEK